ncbi:MAG: GNAT family N-acetyltransferase [Pseudomonadota bacterium]
MNTLRFRKAARSDMDWLYQTFKLTMQHYIQQTWGWDELLQQHSFHDHLPAATFSIASRNGFDVGAYSVLEKNDHLWLEMVLVLPELQNQGMGSILLRRAQEGAGAKGKPLRLSVLKVNPAQQFYKRLGFQVTGEDAWSFKMEWSNPSV